MTYGTGNGIEINAQLPTGTGRSLESNLAGPLAGKIDNIEIISITGSLQSEKP